MSDTERITKLERSLREALNSISELEGKLDTLRKNHWSAIVGHELILFRLVNHTKCPAAPGKSFKFPNVR